MPNEAQWEAAYPLLDAWGLQAAKAKQFHDTAHRKRERQRWALGIPAIILSTIVGSAEFITLNKQADHFSKSLQISLGVLGLLAAVIAALDKYLNLEKRSGQHLQLSAQASGIQMETQRLRATPPIHTDPAPVLLSIQGRLTALTADNVMV